MTDNKKEIEQKVATQWTMSTYQGRAFLWRLIDICGVYHDISGDVSEVHRRLGRRSIGLQILGILTDANEDLVFKMMEEARDRQAMEAKENERERNKTTDRDIISGNYDPDELIDSGHHESEPPDSERDYGGIV